MNEALTDITLTTGDDIPDLRAAINATVVLISLLLRQEETTNTRRDCTYVLSGVLNGVLGVLLASSRQDSLAIQFRQIADQIEQGNLTELAAYCEALMRNQGLEVNVVH